MDGKPKDTCKFVYPNDKSAKQGNDVICQWVTNTMKSPRSCNNRPIVVEKVKDEFDRMFVALSLSFKLDKDSPQQLIITMIELVKRYGFDHIIIIRVELYDLCLLQSNILN